MADDARQPGPVCDHGCRCHASGNGPCEYCRDGYDYTPAWAGLQAVRVRKAPCTLSGGPR